MLCISHHSPVHLFNTPSLAPASSTLSFRSCFCTISTCTTCTYAVIGRLVIFYTHNVSIIRIFLFVLSFQPTLIPTFRVCPHISFPIVTFHLCLLNSRYPHLLFCVIFHYLHLHPSSDPSQLYPCVSLFSPTPHFLIHFPGLNHSFLHSILSLTPVHPLLPNAC